MTNVVHNNEIQNETAASPSQILVMGPQASAFAKALVRLQGNTEIFHAETAAEAIELLSTQNFDHVLVDNRIDGALTLTIPRLAQMDTVKNITVLAGPNSAQTIAAIPGIDQVITPPYNPLEIANSLCIEVKDNRNENLDCVHQRREEDEAPAEVETEIEAEEHDDRPALIKGISAVVHFIPGLTPILSMLYKNIALTILAALFVAFVSYGIMIAFFLTSGDWSSPLQLQKGHELVAKAEAENNSLKIKRNLIKQQIAEAHNKADEAKAALLRANTLADITAGIIDQEIKNHESNFETLKTEVATLKNVVEGYGGAKQRQRDMKKLKSEYARRIITRQSYQSSLLAAAQIERQVAEIDEQITSKKNQIKKIDQSVAYLTSLKQQMASDNIVISGTGQAAYVPLTNQIIEVRQTRTTAKSNLSSAEASIPSLENSLMVINNGIDTLNASPMIAALEKPVTVLFVPYDNIDAYGEHQPLYACSLSLFWCSKVGETGPAISGEISTTHPFFGKPIRGQFVEAHLTDESAAKKDILHVGRPPFFF